MPRLPSRPNTPSHPAAAPCAPWPSALIGAILTLGALAAPLTLAHAAQPVADSAKPSVLQGLPSMSLTPATLDHLPPTAAGRQGSSATDAGDPGQVPGATKKKKKKTKAEGAAQPALDTSLSLPASTAIHPAALATATAEPGAASGSPAADATKPRRARTRSDGDGEAPRGKRIAPRVLIVTMFEPEARLWLERLGPWQRTRITGLADDYPYLHCNRQQVCVVTTGMGHTNAAASAMSLVLSSKLDLRRSYVMVAGIAGINPEHGTLGTPAWARFLIDWGLQWELDAREAPADWPSGYLGINTRSPQDKPPLDYRTEVFQIDGNLLRRAVALSKDVTLADSDAAQAYRARYPQAPANQPPRVAQCDTLAGDTWFSGQKLGERAAAWTRILTNGAGTYCTTQQEDNATYEALQRGAKMGRVDLSRVLVLRAGSDFDRPPPGTTAVHNLLNYTEQGGFDIAVENLYRTGLPVVKAISGQWKRWQRGVPQD